MKARTLAILIAVVTAAVWAPSVRNGFVWDDRYDILRSDRLHHARAVVDVFAHHAMWSADQPEAGDLDLSPAGAGALAVDWQLWHTRPAGYHVTNVLLHVLATLALLLALSTLVDDRRTAAILALLFALHPANAEAVAWINGRSEMIALGFGALAIWAARRQRLSSSDWRCCVDARQGDRPRLRARRRRARRSRQAPARLRRADSRDRRVLRAAPLRPRRRRRAARDRRVRHARPGALAHHRRCAVPWRRAPSSCRPGSPAHDARARRLGRRRRVARRRSSSCSRRVAWLAAIALAWWLGWSRQRRRSPRSIIRGLASAAGSTSACQASLLVAALATRAPPSAPAWRSPPSSPRSLSWRRALHRHLARRRRPLLVHGRRDPDDAWAWRALGTVRLAQDRDADAADCFHRAATLDRTEEVHAAYALEAFAWTRLGRCDDAIAQFHAHPVTPALPAEDFDAAAEACKSKALTTTTRRVKSLHANEEIGRQPIDKKMIQIVGSYSYVGIFFGVAVCLGLFGGRWPIIAGIPSRG